MSIYPRKRHLFAEAILFHIFCCCCCCFLFFLIKSLKSVSLKLLKTACLFFESILLTSVSGFLNFAPCVCCKLKNDCTQWFCSSINVIADRKKAIELRLAFEKKKFINWSLLKIYSLIENLFIWKSLDVDEDAVLDEVSIHGWIEKGLKLEGWLNFFALCSEVISRGNRWSCRKMSAVSQALRLQQRPKNI